MKCIILGAGEGNRLRPHTLERPKCLVELAGRPILDYEIAALRAAGLNDIRIVTGYRADQIETRGLPCYHNPDYASTNMVTSLMMAREMFDGLDDVLISYADIIYETQVVDALLACEAGVSMAVNTGWRELWSVRMDDPLSDAESLKLDAEGNVTELGKKPGSYDDIGGQYMGLILFRAPWAGQLGRVYDGLDPSRRYDGKDLPNMYMTSFLQHWIDSISPIRAVEVRGGWLEVDTTEDLEIYQKMHLRGELEGLCRLAETG
ncbi:MAG: phosphocholine cytidylyltransferase family protein [bacterium]|nr:phosphocholine cytidylyltransferase family protein [bacterium]